MKRMFGVTAFAVLVLILPGRALASPLCIPRAEPPRAELTLVKTEVVDERTTVYSFQSAAVSRVVRARVIVPDEYLTDPQRKFPVVYHLHGTGNTALTWNLADVKKYVLGTTPVILVMPDGGTTDFYTDWIGTPLASVGQTTPPPAWDTFDNLELVPWIDQHLRTNGRRAIAGSSMGGFGAISYPERHPGLYVAAGSLSGAIDIETTAAKAVLPTYYGACIFGDPISDAAHFREVNPAAHVDRLRGLSLYMQVGNGLPGEYDSPATAGAGPLEILIHEMNVNFLAALKAAEIPVTARFYGNGTHPDGVGPTRFYDFDGMRLFLAQALPLLTTTPVPSCTKPKTRTYTLPRGATRVRVSVDGKRRAVRVRGGKFTLSVRPTATARHVVRITARVRKRAYVRATRITSCATARR